jgi:hypothetical protein
MSKRAFEYNNKSFVVEDSNRKNKQLKATFKDGKEVHFGDKEMEEYPSTKRGDDYCTRSYGIGKKYGSLDDIQSPNTLSRVVLWKCKGKKSMKTFKEAGLNEKEDTFDNI